MITPRAKEVPLNYYKFQVGMATVVLLVALRLGLGYHFLYEGAWKIKHANEFTAEPFLTQAKGPMAPLFYAMTADIDGRQRLQIVEEKGKRKIDTEPIASRWYGLCQEYVARYGSAAGDETAQKRFEGKAEKTFELFRRALEVYLADNFDEIEAHFGSLDRFQEDPSRSQGAAFQKKRRWDKMMELRKEANGWLSHVEKMEKDYRNALWTLLSDDQRALGPVPASWNPLRWSRIEQINFAVTYGLTAIGLCLVLGLCTRLAAIGGGMFMFFVVLTQPAWPLIYPPDPPVVGHALLVNKDFVEMLALFTVATTAVGRWGGLDFFVWNYLGRPLLVRWNAYMERRAGKASRA